MAIQYQQMTSALMQPISLVGEKVKDSAPSVIAKAGDVVYQVASKAIHTYGQKVVDALHGYTSFIKPAFAEMSVSEFCNPNLSEYIKKSEFAGLIRGINDGISEGGNVIVRSPDVLREAGEKAACLEKLYGPGTADNVQSFSPQAMQYFMDNYEALKETAPALVNSMTVPEFGVEAMGATAVLLGGLVMAHRYGPKIADGARYTARGTKNLFKKMGRKIT